MKKSEIKKLQQQARQAKKDNTFRDYVLKMLKNEELKENVVGVKTKTDDDIERIIMSLLHNKISNVKVPTKTFIRMIKMIYRGDKDNINYMLDTIKMVDSLSLDEAANFMSVIPFSNFDRCISFKKIAEDVWELEN